MVDEVDRPVDIERLDDVLVEQDELGRPDVLDVVEGASLEIVNADHLVTAPQELITEVRAEETRSTRDQTGGHGGPA